MHMYLSSRRGISKLSYKAYKCTKTTEWSHCAASSAQPHLRECLRSPFKLRCSWHVRLTATSSDSINELHLYRRPPCRVRRHRSGVKQSHTTVITRRATRRLRRVLPAFHPRLSAPGC
ncbi:hypothetical protein FIBSPDRAFT_137461 [Athelia psychrophila]|uniref:Uncharacterized protein n=1 Tax=Athelia psychrophila TaxID=1759441 RepID=A0A166C1C7_9AGAM|nr:hypothetical protein FIBSPDRAFT_137461 [Fibularhizoctonia sp. CBS 109695]